MHFCYLREVGIICTVALEICLTLCHIECFMHAVSAMALHQLHNHVEFWIRDTVILEGVEVTS